MQGITGDYTLLIGLLAAGILLIGAEVFVPGAVVGTIGALCLLGAAGVAFSISPVLGGYVSAGIVVLVAVTIVLWIKLFPRSAIGRKMTLDQDGKAFKAADPKQALVGRTGTAQSDLRPAGFALVDGKRVDVITEGGLIAKGAPIRVVRVEGNRTIVRKVES